MIIVSEFIKGFAFDVYKSGTPKKSTPEFDIFELPSGFLDHLALILFKEGRDFHPGTVPTETLIIPVTINNRQGYMLDKKIAFSYNSTKKE
jgi:hypothetical protein